MEQHRTGHPHIRTPRRTPSLPPQARGGRRPDAAVRRSAPPAGPPPRRLFPDPRLTGLGAGLLCGLAMLLVGALNAALLDASPTVYGVLFLPVSLLTALWVRPGDLVTAPVVLPLAFTAGLLPGAEGSGLTGWGMGVVTALATQAPWLYAGTLVAALTVLVRGVRRMGRPRKGAERAPRAGRGTGRAQGIGAQGTGRAPGAQGAGRPSQAPRAPQPPRSAQSPHSPQSAQSPQSPRSPRTPRAPRNAQGAVRGGKRLAAAPAASPGGSVDGAGGSTGSGGSDGPGRAVAPAVRRPRPERG